MAESLVSRHFANFGSKRLANAHRAPAGAVGGLEVTQPSLREMNPCTYASSLRNEVPSYARAQRKKTSLPWVVNPNRSYQSWEPRLPVYASASSLASGVQGRDAKLRANCRVSTRAAATLQLNLSELET